ncbi:hypothetical protein [uncultured Clostridium sp.]|uniref:hypothetical protein n=1 Tax=uncultured Clostridium sp. TaxID=59620 RepID=UPI0025D306DD|nr:hypothetical protein [uncultured Clostridium sp.]
MMKINYFEEVPMRFSADTEVDMTLTYPKIVTHDVICNDERACELNYYIRDFIYPFFLFIYNYIK